MGQIESVRGYIEAVENIIGREKRTGCRIVYRGEPKFSESPTVSSRFLKVDDNFLAALFDACGPGLEQGEEVQDGQVILLLIENEACRKDSSLEDSRMFEQQPFFRNNYMLISPQGAMRELFLFSPGELPCRLPGFMVQSLRIPGAGKKRILEELCSLFGFGQEKAGSGSFGIEEALEYAVRQLRRELDYELDRACVLVRSQPEAVNQQMEKIRRILEKGRRGVADYENSAACSQGVRFYNQTIRNFAENLRACGLGEIDWRELTAGQEVLEEPKPEKKRNSPTLKRIISISLDGREIQVKNAAEAMVRTVEYILETYHPQEEQVKRVCNDWLAWEDSRIAAQEGYFRGSAKPMTGSFGTIWVGTSSNQGKKNRQLQGLCQLAEVVPNTIFWYSKEDQEPEFFW